MPKDAEDPEPPEARDEVAVLLRAAFRSRADDSAPLDAAAFGEKAYAGERSGVSLHERYRVTGEIARGGMGVVLRAVDREIGREVAVKVLPREQASIAGMVERFVHEGRICGKLQHPGIVPVYDIGTDSAPSPYFTMKLVQGETLKQVLARRRSPDERRQELLRILEQICLALAYAHERGVVHRDLKPANVMIGPFGEVQVMDWGLAKVLGRDEPAIPVAPPTERERSRAPHDPARTRSGSVFGTPAYMPPEQAQGRTDDLDERSDVFGLGALLCEVLTGAPPYVGSSASAVRALARAARLEDAAARLHRCGAEPALVQLALRCLAPAPEDRPRSAAVVAEELRLHLASVEERARQAELSAAEARASAASERRARRLTLALAAGALLATASYGWWWWDGARRAAAASDRASVAMADARLLQARAEGAAPEERLARLELAAAAARQALSVADSGGAGREVLERALDLLATTEHQVAAAREELERARWAQALGRRLDSIRADFRARHAGGASAAAYREAFAGFGIDIADLEQGEALVRVQESGAAVRVAEALDDWALAPNDPSAELPRERLLDLASRLDPDPWRERLRRAVREGDQGELERLARSEEMGRQDPATVALLGGLLAHRGAGELAVELFESGLRHHPSEFWLHFGLAEALCGHVAPPRLEAALGAARAAVALRPEDPDALYLNGTVLLLLGRNEQGAELLERVLRLAPEHTMAHANLGYLRFHAGDFDGALEHYRAALEVSDAASVHFNVGVLFEARGQAEEAIAAYRRAIAADPTMSQPHLNLGNLLVRAGDVQGGLAHQRRAVELGGGADALSSTGNTLRNLGRLDEAEELLIRALELEEDDVATHFNLVLTLEAMGEFAGGLEHAERAFELAPENGEVACALGRMQQQLGLHDEAAASFRRSLELGHSCADARAQWASTLASAAEGEPLLQLLEEAIARSSERVGLGFALGEALREADRLAEAAAAYEAELELGEHRAARIHLAFVLLESGEPEGAAALLELGLERSPDDPFLWTNLGSALAALGRAPEAIAAFRRSGALAPADVDLLYGFGAYLEQLGDIDGAAAAYERVLAMAPDHGDALVDLGGLRARQGRLEEAVRAGRRGRALLHAAEDTVVARMLRESERMLELSAAAPDLESLEAAVTRADAADGILLARLLRARGATAAAARAYKHALGLPGAEADEPDLRAAAAAAASAACGVGADAAALSPAERTALHQAALGRVREFVRGAVARAAEGGPRRSEAMRLLGCIRADPRLTLVREPAESAALDPRTAERWRALWAELDDALAELRKDA